MERPGLTEKSRAARHAHNADKHQLWHSRQLRDILGRHAALKRNTSQHLKFAKPLQAGQELVLMTESVSLTGYYYYPHSGHSGGGKGVGLTWLASCSKK